MRRVVVYPGRIAVEAADIPAPRPNEALVRTLAAGVCGSDLHAAHGRHPFVPLPYRPGHEVVGVIETTGSAVEGYPPGQRFRCHTGHRHLRHPRRRKAAAFYAGDDLGDLPAIREVNEWAERSGRPTLTVGVSPAGSGPVAEQADVTAPDPQGLLSLLRQILPNPADPAAVAKG